MRPSLLIRGDSDIRTIRLRISGTMCALVLMLTNGCEPQSRHVARPQGPFLVAANQDRGLATFVDLTSGSISHVKLGADPHEVAVSPDNKIAVLTVPSRRFRFRSSTQVIVLDLAGANKPGTVDLPGYEGPHGVTFLSDSVALIGTLRGTSAAYVDVRNGRVLRAVNGLPPNPYVISSGSTGKAFASIPRSQKIIEIDLHSGVVLRTIGVPDEPSGIVTTPDGTELFAAVWRQDTGGGIAIFDLGSNSMVARLPATQPRRLTITADGKNIVVSDQHDLHFVDRVTRQVRSVPLGKNAIGSGVDCSPNSTRCYVALVRRGEIVEVDVVNARVLRRFPVHEGVDGLAYVAR